MRVWLPWEGDALVAGVGEPTELLYECGLLCGLRLYFWAWTGLCREGWVLIELDRDHSRPEPGAPSREGHGYGTETNACGRKGAIN